MTDGAASSTARASAMRVEGQLHTGKRSRPRAGLAAVLACTGVATVGALRGRRLVGLLLIVSLVLVLMAAVVYAATFLLFEMALRLSILASLIFWSCSSC